MFEITIRHLTRAAAVLTLLAGPALALSGCAVGGPESSEGEPVGAARQEIICGPDNENCVCKVVCDSVCVSNARAHCKKQCGGTGNACYTACYADLRSDCCSEDCIY